LNLISKRTASLAAVMVVDSSVENISFATNSDEPNDSGSTMNENLQDRNL
jgi:hypothetical protein